MKRLIYLLIAAALFDSCVSSSRIVENDDQNKGTKSMKLEFRPKVIAEENTEVPDSQTKFDLNSSYFFEEKIGGRPEIRLDFRWSGSVGNKEIDSTMYLILDGEKIELVSENIKNMPFDQTIKPSTITSQPKNQIFIIPENLWISIVKSEKIQYRLYIGEEGIDVLLTPAQIKKVKYFYELAIKKRDANFPVIPEGHMKW